MNCPICKKETKLEDNPYRPFCSSRCKLIDLGDWASGRYRIPTKERPPDDDGSDANHED